MIWRRLRTGETDHEALWLGVSLGSLALAWFWLHFGLPLLRCPFHDMMGCACPTCGVTRCVRSALGGDFAAAFWINPLAFGAFGALALFDIYAATILTLRLPRLRGDELPAWVGKTVRVSAIMTIAANWAWLVRRGV